jgi:hypothetical protein
VAEVPWGLLKCALNSKLVAGQCFQTSAKSIKTLLLVESWLLDGLTRATQLAIMVGFSKIIELAINMNKQVCPKIYIMRW